MNSPDQEPRWFHAQGKLKAGPFSLEELRQLVHNRQLSAGDMVLPFGSTRWLAARDVEGLFPDDLEPTVAQAFTPLPPTVGSAPAEEPLPTLPPVEAPERVLQTDASGLAGYELLGELGRGGMGVVYRARHRQLDRLVALKMVLAGGHAGQDERARFLTEAQAIARLRHPGIVQIYEIGDNAGQPFFSLEYCAGGSLAQRLNGNPLPGREAAALVEQLARAMAAAHAAGIVHRDLKPANILMADSQHEAAIPKITDFGLARKLDDVQQTRSGAILGTPSYMAPEQAEGRTHDVGPLADVWALGAILYECLTGRPPFRGASTIETIYLVCGREPVPPRQLTPATARDLETICLKCLQKEPAKRYAAAGELADDLQRFLAGEPIRARPVGRLERAWRWSKRNPALATVTGVLLLSLVAGFVGIDWKRREADSSAQEARTARTEAERREREARRFVYAALMNQLPEAWQRGDLFAVERTLKAFAPRPGEEDLRGLEWHYYWGRLYDSRLTLLGHTSQVRVLAYSRDGSLIASAGHDLTVRLWDARTGALRWMLPCGVHQSDLVFSPDGELLALATSGVNVTVFDVRQGKVRHSFPQANLYALDFSADGRALVTGGPQGSLAFFSLEGQLLLEIPAAHRQWVYALRFSKDGRRLFSLGGVDPIRLWEVDGTWQPGSVKRVSESAAAPPREASRLAVSADGSGVASVSGTGQAQYFNVGADGKFTLAATFAAEGTDLLATTLACDDRVLAAVGTDRRIRCWDLKTRKEQPSLMGHPRTVWALVASPTRPEIASAGDDGAVKVWSLAEPSAARPTDGVHAVAFSPRDDVLATAGGDGRVRLWDAATGAERGRPRAHSAAVHAVAFTPDGMTLVAGDAGGQLRLWRLDESGSRRLDVGQAVTSLAVAPDGTRVAVGTEDGWLKVFELPGLKRVVNTRLHLDRILALSFAPDSRRVATGGADFLSYLFDVTTATTDHQREHLGRVRAVMFTPDGKSLLTTAEDGTIRQWSTAGPQRSTVLKFDKTLSRVGSVVAADGKSCYWAVRWADQTMLERWSAVELPKYTEEHIHPPLRAPPQALALARDGKQLAVGAADGTVALWQPGRANEARILSAHRPTAGVLACSPDGATLALGTDFAVRLIDRATGQERALLTGHTHALTALAFTADSQLLASTAFDGTIRLWDVGTGAARATWKTPNHAARALAFTPDGQTLLSGCGVLDSAAELLAWDVKTGKVIRTIAGPRWPIRGVAVTADAKVLIVVGGTDWHIPGEVLLFDVASGRQLAALSGLRDAVHTLALAPDERTLATAGRDGGIYLWDISDVHAPRLRLLLPGHAGTVTALAFARDGRTLVSAGEDRTLRFWQPNLEQPLGTMPVGAVVRALVVSPSGDEFIHADDEGLLGRVRLQAPELSASHSGRPLDLEAESARVTAATWRRTAAQQFTEGRASAAEENVGRAVELLDATLRRQPDETALALDLAAALLLRAETRPTEPDLLRTMDLLERGSDASTLHLRLRAGTRLLTLRAARQEWDAAEQAAERLRTVLTALKPLAAVTHLDDLAKAARRLGELDAARGRRTQAQAANAEAVGWLERLRRERWNDDGLWRELIELVQAQADGVAGVPQQLELQEHVAALAQRRHLARSHDLDRREHLARSYGRVAQLMVAQKHFRARYYTLRASYQHCACASQTAGSARARHAAAAVRLLETAVQLGYKNIAELEQSAVFEPLRGREDFKNLLARLKRGV